MRFEDMVPASVDDHVVEPPDIFDRYLRVRWQSRAPRITRLADGGKIRVFEKQRIPNIGLNAVVGRRPEEYGVEPTAYDPMRDKELARVMLQACNDCTSTAGAVEIPAAPSRSRSRRSGARTGWPRRPGGLGARVAAP